MSKTTKTVVVAQTPAPKKKALAKLQTVKNNPTRNPRAWIDFEVTIIEAAAPRFSNTYFGTSSLFREQVNSGSEYRILFTRTVFSPIYLKDNIGTIGVHHFHVNENAVTDLPGIIASGARLKSARAPLSTTYQVNSETQVAPGTAVTTPSAYQGGWNSYIACSVADYPQGSVVGYFRVTIRGQYRGKIAPQFASSSLQNPF